MVVAAKMLLAIGVAMHGKRGRIFHTNVSALLAAMRCPSIHEVRGAFGRERWTRFNDATCSSGCEIPKDPLPTDANSMPWCWRKITRNQMRPRGTANWPLNHSKLLAWYIHAPKTGGSALTLALAHCLGTCANVSSRGPRGQYVADLAQAGLVPLSDTSIRNCSLLRRSLGSASSSPTQLPYDCQPSRRNKGGVCGFIANHWPWRISVAIQRIVRRSGMKPVVLGSVRNPFDYYVSHYLYALQRQRAGVDNGGLDPLGPEHDVCLRRAPTAACVAAFRGWIEQEWNANRSMSGMMRAYYGPGLKMVPDWGWMRAEALFETVESALRSVLGRELDAPTDACLRERLGRGTNCGSAGCESLRRTRGKSVYAHFYNADLRRRVRHVDAAVFTRFNYSIN